jgi:hypothetical protein
VSTNRTQDGSITVTLKKRADEAFAVRPAVVSDQLVNLERADRAPSPEDEIWLPFDPTSEVDIMRLKGMLRGEP